MVQQLIEQLEILQNTYLAVFPESNLSRANVFQHIIEFVAAERLPSVVLQNADPQELDLLPERIATTVPFVFEKIQHLLMFELSNLHLHITIVYLTISGQSTDNILPRSRVILMSGSKKLSLWMEHGTSSRVAWIIPSFSCSFCNRLNRVLRSKNCKCTLRVPNWRLQLP